MMPWTLNYDFLKAPENGGNKPTGQLCPTSTWSHDSS